MTDADKLSTIADVLIYHNLMFGTGAVELLQNTSDLLDAVPPEMLAAIKAGVMVVIPVGFARFLKAVMESARDSSGCDVDGGWVQDYATDTGILVAVPVTEPCGEGENCVCAEYGFPTECYRYSQPFKDLRSALDAAPTKPEE